MFGNNGLDSAERREFDSKLGAGTEIGWELRVKGRGEDRDLPPGLDGPELMMFIEVTLVSLMGRIANVKVRRPETS